MAQDHRKSNTGPWVRFLFHWSLLKIKFMPLTGPIAVWLGLWSLKCDVLREILTVFYIYEEVPVKQEASWLKFLFRCFLASTDQDHRHPLVRGSKVKGWLSLFVFCFFFFSLCVCQKATYIFSRVPIHCLTLRLNVSCLQFFQGFGSGVRIWFPSPPLWQPFLASLYFFLSFFFLRNEEWGREGRNIEAPL